MPTRCTYPVFGGPGAMNPNRKPTRIPSCSTTRASEPSLFASQPAEGAHEVIVHAPEHATSMAGLTEERFAGAVAAWRERMRFHALDASYVHVIVNEGPDAGASLEHSHAQLYALRFVPAATCSPTDTGVILHAGSGET